MVSAVLKLQPLTYNSKFQSTIGHHHPRQINLPLTNMASIIPRYRPSIRELSNFLLAPQTQIRSTRCVSNLSRQLRHTIKPIPRRSPADTSRPFITSSALLIPKPLTRDRGPPSKEDTQTDFSSLDILGNTPAPSTSIDACLWDGFHFNSGVKITGGTGVLLVGGEAFSWRPWLAGKGDMKLVNEKGQWEVDDVAWGLLELVWPKPGMYSLLLGILIEALVYQLALVQWTDT